MRLDRYIGEPPKFRVFRRLDNPELGSHRLPVVAGFSANQRAFQDETGTYYAEMPPFEYFVMALKDVNTVDGLAGYGMAAGRTGDEELSRDIARLTAEAASRSDRKKPD